jgi:hypothetical protein
MTLRDFDFYYSEELAKHHDEHSQFPPKYVRQGKEYHRYTEAVIAGVQPRVKRKDNILVCTANINKIYLNLPDHIKQTKSKQEQE